MSKMRVSCGRVAFFLIFGVCKIRCRVGAVLGVSGGGFWELFGRFWVDFWVLKRSKILTKTQDPQNPPGWARIGQDGPEFFEKRTDAPPLESFLRMKM